MNTNNTFSDQLKHLYYTGGMTVKLIFINLLVFLFIGFTSVVGTLMQGDSQFFIDVFNHKLFTLDTNLIGFLYKPWGIFTSIFAHFSFMHILFNMLMLYFTGRAFEQLFSEKKLLYTYILGGIIGGIFEIVAHSIFPVFETYQTVIVGASGSVMAIFMAIAFYRPNLEVNLFGVFPLKIIYLALAYLVMNLLSLAKPDGTAHFAHLGGAFIGYLSVKNMNNSKNIITRFQNFIESIVQFFKKLFTKKQPKFTVQKGGSARGGFKTDEEFNYEAKQRQIQIDAILDKIAKSGYESLSKAEKEFLFKQSQNGK